MNLSRFGGKAIGALALCSVVWLAPAAQAQQIGVVDDTKLAENYTKFMTAKSELDKRWQTLEKQVPARQFLTDADGKRFDALITKKTLTAVEQTELQKLVDAGLNRNAKYMGLAGKLKPTDAESKELKELVEQGNRNKEALRKLSEELQESMIKTESEIDAEYMNRAAAVIQKIAEDRKLLLVVRKAAVAWSGPAIDITEEAIKRMNQS